ncbi:MAG: hypothetical protein V7607_4380 [Solirubrobacteraceae bacterium]
MRRLVLPALATLCVAAAVVPVATSAAGPQPPDCPLLGPRKAVDHPLTLPDGTKVVARDPYGGLLSRNRLFFDFSVRRPGHLGAPRGVTEVSWALDGTVVRTDPKPPYEWKGVSGSNRRMPAGDHQISVSVAPAGGGAAVTTSFAITATDCQPATAFVSIDESLGGGTHPVGGSQLDATSSFESATGPTMTSVAFSGSGFATRVPRSSRGHAAGTLTISGGDRGAARSYRLGVPRSGTTLLRRGALHVALHPGATRFLTVTGLPAGIRSASVRLVGRGARGLFVKRSRAGRCHYATAAEIAGPEGRIVVSGGTSTGLCR